MADAVRGMPRAPEVNIFYAQVGCDQQLFAARNSQHGAIVADPADNPTAAGPAGHPPNLCDEFFLGQQAFTISLRHTKVHGPY
jgi:hypothetical protein